MPMAMALKALNVAMSEEADKPPAGSIPINQTPWSGGHQEIKDGIGADPADNVKIKGSLVPTKNSFLLVLLFFTVVAANAQPDLLQSKNCFSCHAMESHVIGPAYKDVASKYRGDKEAKSKLALKIMQGGSGVWGTIAMPANPQVSPEEAKSLVAFILSQK
jgi:cytochrome c